MASSGDPPPFPRANFATFEHLAILLNYDLLAKRSLTIGRALSIQSLGVPGMDVPVVVLSSYYCGFLTSLPFCLSKVTHL